MSDAPVVGSAAFELRASRAKIKGDMADARREYAAEAQKTEEQLAGIIGTGTAKGAKKAAEALKEPKQAGIEAGTAIRDSMKKAGDEIAESIGRGARKAKADLESVAQKAREVQKVKLPTPTVPTEATHRLVTNPINGTQSWVPRMDPTGGLPPQSAPMTAVPVTPGLKEAAGDAGKLKDALDGVKPSAESTAEGLGKIDKSALLTGAAIGALIGGAIMVTKTMWDMGRAAMQAAGEIADTATRIGVSTDALQEWRYVAVKSGEDAKSADQALSSFAEKLALAGSQLNKQAVTPGNLYWGSRSDNADDAKRNNRIARGERAPSAKLSEEQVEEVRAAYRSGRAQRQIARDFGISQSNVSQICSGSTWRAS